MRVPSCETYKQSFESCMPMLGTVEMRVECATGTIARYRSKTSLAALNRCFEEDATSIEECLEETMVWSAKVS